MARAALDLASKTYLVTGSTGAACLLEMTMPCADAHCLRQSLVCHVADASHAMFSGSRALGCHQLVITPPCLGLEVTSPISFRWHRAMDSISLGERRRYSPGARQVGMLVRSAYMQTDCAWVTPASPSAHTCRSQEKAQKAAAAVKSASGNDRVHALSADLSSLEAVRALAADVKAVAPDGLDVLVNNAGVCCC
jgi:short chain dehydrogenase